MRQAARDQPIPPAFRDGTKLAADGATPHEQLFWGWRRVLKMAASAAVLHLLAGGTAHQHLSIDY